jgi:hypothetical protein
VFQQKITFMLMHRQFQARRTQLSGEFVGLVNGARDKAFRVFAAHGVFDPFVSDCNMAASLSVRVRWDGERQSRVAALLPAVRDHVNLPPQ